MENKKDNMKIKIRGAHKDDAEQIQKLYNRVWIETYENKDLGINRETLERRFGRLLSKESIEWLSNFIERDIPNNHKYIVAVEGDTVIGVMYLEKEADHNRIQGLYILSEYQRRGLGKKLWNVAISFFNKDNPVILDVAEYNQGATNFYKKLGFIDTGKRFLEKVSDPGGVKRPMMEMVCKNVSTWQ